MDRKDYFYTIPRTDAEAHSSLKWKDLLVFVREKWPKAYSEGIDEIAPLQLSNMQEVFRFSCREEERVELQKKMEPFFRCPETQAHFGSVSLFVAGLAGMQCLARILERRIAAKYYFLLTGEKSYLQQAALGSQPHPENLEDWIYDRLDVWETADFLADNRTYRGLFPGEHRDERVFDLVWKIKTIGWRRCEVLYIAGAEGIS